MQKALSYLTQTRHLSYSTKADTLPPFTVHKLADTLVADPSALFERSAAGSPPLDPASARRAVLDAIETSLLEAKFPACDGPSTITIPFSFD